jgi:hypothetical protein
MIIETIDDWNTVLQGCGCCPVPDSDFVPTRENESLEADILAFYAIIVAQPSGGWIRYRTYRTDWSDGGFLQTEAPRGWRAYIGPNGLGAGSFEVDPTALVYTDGDPKTGTITNTESNPVDLDSARSSGFAAVDAETADYWSLFTLGSQSYVRRTHSDPGTGSPQYIGFVDLVRYRWDITAHTGAWFKITWDVAFYPADGSPAVQVETDLTWEWTGTAGGPTPGTEDDWKSGWYYFGIPPEEGELKIVNIRYSHFRSTKIGTPVSVTGDSEDYT